MHEKLWHIKDIDPEAAEQLVKDAGISRELAILLINRGIKSKEDAEIFINCSPGRLYDPFLMKGVSRAVDIIKDSVAKGEKIGVFGDYDVDGVTATALVCEALKQLGADYGYYLPHRIEEGYGLSPEGIKWALNRQISLAITVDNGVSNASEIAELKSHGIKVIVTDHHEVPQTLPEADVVISPKQKDCPYPNKDLSGVGVAFKLAQALFSGQDDIWSRWIYLAGLGTLADCMNLSLENRVLVSCGIGQINAEPSPGIQALLDAAAYKNKIDTHTVSFVIAPRINAAGRLDHAEFACELLLAEGREKAAELAGKLHALNQKRQKVEAGIQKDIERILLEDPSMLDKNILFLFNKEWHLGVLGIVASKLVDKFNKPVFLMAAKSHYIKGSARAPQSYNIFEMLTQTQEYLMHFGGHKGAGGFSLMEENKDALREALDKAASRYEQMPEALEIDMALNLSQLNLDLVRQINSIEPFGAGNPEPLFLARGVHIQDASLVGNPPVHLRMNIKQDNYLHKVIGFGKDHLYTHIYPDNFFYDIVFTLGIDSYRGVDKVNLICVDIKKPDEIAKSVMRNSLGIYDRLNTAVENRVIDARNIKNKEAYLKNIFAAQKGVTVVFSDQKSAHTAAKMFPEAAPAKKNVGATCQVALTTKNLAARPVFVDYELLAKSKVPIDSEDVILYNLPLCHEDFMTVLDLVKPSGKLHILFSHKEVEQKKTYLKDSFLSRQKLAKIYNVICYLNKQNIEINQKNLFETLKKQAIDLLDFDNAGRIFEELRLCRIIADKEKISFEIDGGLKCNLEDSGVYRGILRQSREAGKAIQLFDEVDLRKLKQEIKALKKKKEKNEELYLEGVNQ